jgi:dTDP-4-dehydrorhamnose 3,5-epimerase
MSSEKLRSLSTTVPNAALEEVEGFSLAPPLQSRTNADGRLRIDPIEGVRYRLARPVSHHNGHLTEAFRTDWGLTEAPIVQVNLTVTFPGRIRGWGLHRFTIDRLFAATRSLLIVCYDGRRTSSTFGRINEFMFGDRNPGLVVIPPGIYHGWQNIGDDEATIVSMPSQLYNYDGPDRWELAWDSADAQAIIPYKWPSHSTAPRSFTTASKEV